TSSSRSSGAPLPGQTRGARRHWNGRVRRRHLRTTSSTAPWCASRPTPMCERRPRLSAEHAVHLAHHFDTPEQQHTAAQLGLWAFLLTEVMLFGAVLTAYAVYRSAHPAEFAAGSAQLSVALGGINTAVLLGSSLTVALAVRAAQLGRSSGAAAFLLLSI